MTGYLGPLVEEAVTEESPPEVTNWNPSLAWSLLLYRVSKSYCALDTFLSIGLNPEVDKAGKNPHDVEFT